MCIKGSLYVILLFQRELLVYVLLIYIYLMTILAFLKAKWKIHLVEQIFLLYWKSEFKTDLPVYKNTFFFLNNVYLK